MRVLVVGAGGREHALAWGLSRSPLVTELHAAPGNAGIARLATCHPVAAEDLEGLVALSRGLGAELVVVGPEAPLVAGLADRLRERGVATFGPGTDGARIEGSKAWAKELMGRADIPTARAGAFTRVADAAAFVDELGGRAVVKADGLAAGKGVTVARRPCDGGTGAHRVPRGRRVRRRGGYRGGGGAARGFRGVGVRTVRRRDDGAAGAVPGLQADRRRRHRAQHRRDGRLLAAAVRGRAYRGGHLGAHGPRCRGDGRRWDRLPRTALRGLHAHTPRAPRSSSSTAASAIRRPRS